MGDGNTNARFREIQSGNPGGFATLMIVLWVGDNIREFPDLTQSDLGNMDAFGTNYFVLPNPMYGSWQKVRFDKLKPEGVEF